MNNSYTLDSISDNINAQEEKSFSDLTLLATYVNAMHLAPKSPEVTDCCQP